MVSHAVAIFKLTLILSEGEQSFNVLTFIIYFFFNLFFCLFPLRYTSDNTCVPDGPNFSMTYYVSYANLIGSFASIMGVVLFQIYLSRGKFRTAFLMAGIVKVAASFFDFVIVKRYNRQIGISDSWFFAMGDAVIYQVITRIEIMPAIVLTSKVCPPGMEASVYALLVSYQNLGQGVSRTVGDGLIAALGIKTIVPCNFVNLPLAIFIAHVALPSLIFPLIFILIPDANMTDDLVNISGAPPPSGFAPVSTADEDDTENVHHHQHRKFEDDSSDIIEKKDYVDDSLLVKVVLPQDDEENDVER